MAASSVALQRPACGGFSRWHKTDRQRATEAGFNYHWPSEWIAQVIEGAGGAFPAIATNRPLVPASSDDLISLAAASALLPTAQAQQSGSGQCTARGLASMKIWPHPVSPAEPVLLIVIVDAAA